MHVRLEFQEHGGFLEGTDECECANKQTVDTAEDHGKQDARQALINHACVCVVYRGLKDDEFSSQINRLQRKTERQATMFG